MDLDLEAILELIYKFGVLPILLVVIYKLYARNKELTEQLVDKNDEIVNLHKDKNDEIREIEKENISLLYRTLAAIKKITGNEK